MSMLKFMAWDGEKMVSPDYITRDGRAWWKENSIPTSSDKVMQFTGWYDKNGQEIYDKYILNAPFANGGNRKIIKRKNFIALVEWSQEYGWVMSAHTDMTYRWYPAWNKCEIIGNIFENPELLEKAK